MHVGMATVFQNTGRTVSDRQIYLNELALADLAEPLGFESIWSVEHHFTDYTMCPDVVQFLSYMAGRTRNLRWVLLAVIDETARHAGHADIIREQIDGQTGR